MRDGFRIIDCDRHVMEPADMWERYLDRPFRHYVGWLVQATDTMGARINDATWRGAFSQDSVSTQAPDRVFKAQGFAACDPWERTLPEVVAAMGERAVVWGSQYPLPDILHFFPNELQSIVEDRHLTEETKRRTLWDNAADLFDIGAGHRS